MTPHAKNGQVLKDFFGYGDNTRCPSKFRISVSWILELYQHPPWIRTKHGSESTMD